MDAVEAVVKFGCRVDAGVVVVAEAGTDEAARREVAPAIVHININISRDDAIPLASDLARLLHGINPPWYKPFLGFFTHAIHVLGFFSSFRFPLFSYALYFLSFSFCYLSLNDGIQRNTENFGKKSLLFLYYWHSQSP